MARVFGAVVFELPAVGLEVRVVLRLAMAEIVTRRFVLRVPFLDNLAVTDKPLPMVRTC